MRALAEEMDLHRARSRLPELRFSQWRQIFKEAAVLFEPSAIMTDPSTEAAVDSSPMHRRPVLFVDGASRGNPGRAAAGGVIYLGGEKIAEFSRFLGLKTNNQAEYEALLLGLALVKERGFEEVEIRSDSQLMVRQLRGLYKVKDAKLKLLFAKAQATLKDLSGYDIVHIERRFNQEADSLANRALDCQGV